MFEDYVKMGGTRPSATHDGWVFTRQFSSHGPFDQQVRDTLRQLADELAAQSVAPDRIVRCEIVLKDLARLGDVMALLRECVSPHLPTIRLVPQNVMYSDTVFAIDAIGVQDAVGELQRFEESEGMPPAAIRVGRTVYTSSVWAEDPSDLRADSEAALEGLFAAIRSAGAEPADLVKNFVLLTDMDDFSAFNEVYAAAHNALTVRPARTSHSASVLPGGARVAIDAIAIVGAEREAVEAGGVDSGLDLPFSTALRADDLLFISGQVGVIAADGSYRVDVGPQTTNMFEIVEGIAQAAGVSVDGYLKTTAVFTNPTARDVFLAEYVHRMPDAAGVLSAYQVERLSFAAILAEMDVVAHVRRDA